MKKNYVIAGMPRTGSTLLYNLIRLMLKYKYDNVNGMFYKKWNKDLNNINVVKIHEFNKELHDNATLIFTSVRDLRDAMASFIRYKNMISSFDLFIDWCEIMTDWYEVWKDSSNYEFVYEDYIKDKNKIIFEIANLLEINITIDDINILLSDIDNLKGSIYNQKTVNLLSIINHRTNGKINSYKSTLTKKQIDYIENNYKKYCYL